MRPITLPRTVTSSENISPWISALSPITNPTLRTSPSTRPSICTSPVETRVPLITMSELMMDGAESWRGRLGALAGTAAMGWGAGMLSLLLLENIAASLDEVVGIFHDIVMQDFVMDMRSGAAAG